jgi:hypothetical protein
MFSLYLPLWNNINIFIVNFITFYVINIIIVLSIFILYFFILFGKYKLENTTKILNIISICLVIVTITGGFIDYYKQINLKLINNAQKALIDLENKKSDKKELPNIIYIIFDAYANEQIIKDIYGYDNREFLSFLENNGFYIVKNGRSNYHTTIQSLASSLNLNYLHEFIQQVENSIDKRPLMRMIRENKVRQFLARYGYTFIALSSGSYSTEIYDADIYVDPLKYDFHFENMVFSNTLLNPLFGRMTTDYQIQNHRERIFKNFDKIPALVQSKSPFFLFAHFICPHPPFVFGKTIFYSKTGDIMMDESTLHKMDKTLRKKYIQAYAEQVDFLNQKIIKMLKDIFAQSATPPIIILQGDHGPRSATDSRNFHNTNWHERFSILNAIYLPGKKNVLYEGVTPVNTFRLIFNEYFGTNYQRLPDKNIF